MKESLVPESYRTSRGARIALAAVISLHAVLLLLMIPDYIADNDLGFHVSLGRQYGEHGFYPWDDLNWAPTGRPNLQGPLLHYGIGILGRILGGEGDDYVLAYTLLALSLWAMAVFTAVFFARRYGGDWAALFSAALFTGSVWSAGSFFVGVPSGWVFVLTPWAIHFFLERRYVTSALVTTAVMYVHLGGSPVAPFGVLLAAAFTRDWKGLLKVGGLCALLAAPFLIHFFYYFDWYNGRRGHVAGDMATLSYLLAVPGVILLLRKPHQHLFLLIWAIAPLAWFFQDRLRFFLQSSIVAAAIAALFLAWLLQRLSGKKIHTILATAIVLVATIFPLGIPSLPIEAVWAAGLGFPRELDWEEARTLAGVMDSAGLGERIVNSYYDSLSGGMAVYSPLHQEYGHWGEVRPRVNPAQDISAGEKLYVLPLPPEDPSLQELARNGWITVHGGSARTTLATLPAAAPSEEVFPPLARMIRDECRWLAEHAINNRMPPPENLFNGAKIEEFRRTTTLQRNRAGRIQTALIIYAYSLEAGYPDLARNARSGARAWGSIANFLGDETAIDYLGYDRFEVFRENVANWGDAVFALSKGELTFEQIDGHSEKLFEEFFGSTAIRRAGK
ncbi:MAG: hypothetical protein JSU96_15610 [Acidobacteriota bacterium]|nr:MAG: hypothetical protein JSU96_15610 [Acidobacteriota bacterium]